MGNSGAAGEGTLVAPADAFGILAVGSVNAAGIIASSSSQGPTYDGRTKPEVCAQGVMVFMAREASDSNYGYRNGTSYSTPLTAGVVCLMIQAYPALPPAIIRQGRTSPTTSTAGE
jgi:subtilisin family serine protease